MFCLNFIFTEGRKGQFETLQYFPNIKEDIFGNRLYTDFFCCSCLVGFIVDIEHNQPEKVP